MAARYEGVMRSRWKRATLCAVAAGAAAWTLAYLLSWFDVAPWAPGAPIQIPSDAPADAAVKDVTEAAEAATPPTAELGPCSLASDAGPFSYRQLNLPRGFPQICKCDGRGCCTCY